MAKPSQTKATPPSTGVVDFPIADLIPAEYNPRDVTPQEEDDIRASLLEFGFQGVVIVNRHPDRMNVIVGGHQRCRVARDLGITHVPAMFVNLDLEAEKKLNLRLNKNQGHWDFEKLATAFTEDVLTSVGFSDVSFLAEFTPFEEHPEPAGEPAGEPSTLNEPSAEPGQSFDPRPLGHNKAADPVEVTIVIGHIRCKVSKAAFTSWLTTLHELRGYGSVELKNEVLTRLGILDHVK